MINVDTRFQKAAGGGNNTTTRYQCCFGGTPAAHVNTLKEY